ncbi:MAG: hypothetical protein OXH15_20035 [Gammaproteobacteria bacterium]|nr:hypothetical protein [Gammaproteobacteria bacterium]
MTPEEQITAIRALLREPSTPQSSPEGLGDFLALLALVHLEDQRRGLSATPLRDRMEGHRRLYQSGMRDPARRDDVQALFAELDRLIAKGEGR